MKFLSICSGIEAASTAWEPLGWQAVGFSEIDKFASAVLAHRHPTVPNFGDMLGYRSWDVPPFDILVGGPPCQAFSVSGLQHGLADPRGQLSLTYCDLADHFDPAFTLWENVPGVLSNRTNPFGCLLGRLCGADAPLLPESGHVWPGAGILSGPKRTLAWRTLDAQYFGLAQRRKRVFLLASRGSGNWTCAAALFPVSEGVPGNTPPMRPERQRAAALAARGVRAFGASDNPLIANCLTAREGKGPDSDATTVLIVTPEGVRRLTPRECERLMGTQDDHTLIPFGRKPAADAPRYKAIGNSMAVNVMRWIGERILFAQSIMPLCSCGTVKLGAQPLCPICD
jgi:site-specific DNA-cytosine methylase